MKKNILIFMVISLLTGNNLFAKTKYSEDFIFTVDTRKAIGKAEDALKFTIPINSTFSNIGQTYNYHVDCNNDGVYEEKNQTKPYTCMYKKAGVYSIRIAGKYPAFSFADDIGYLTDIIVYNDAKKLISIDHWGTQKWTTMHNGFSNCSNLVGMADDTPDLRRVKNMERLFYHCTQFNQPLNDWNMSNVMYMSSMFRHATSFNQPLNHWDTSSVIRMPALFSDTENFNQDISDWNTSKVEDIGGLFNNASAFNQPLNQWDVSRVKDMFITFKGAKHFNQPLNDWNTSRVTDMHAMFKNASAFNQPLDKWDTSSVTGMSSIFKNAEVFNQSLDTWNLSKVKDSSHSNYIQLQKKGIETK
jgi:surface protein